MPKPRSRWLHHLKLGGIVLAILLAADLALDAFNWPFTQRAVVSSLEKLSKCDVKIGRFHKQFLPHPGYVADTVTFTRNGPTGPSPLVTIRHLHCQGSWIAILSITHRITRIDLDGAHFMIPRELPPPLHGNLKATLPTTVAEIYAPGAVLEIAPRNGDTQCTRFDFPLIHLANVARDKAMKFNVRIVNAHLIGTADVAGSLGPLRLADAKQTHVTGTFRLSSLDLSANKEVAGTASASGRFEGELDSLKLQGRTEIPDFEVKHSGHPQGLTAECHAVVDGTRGNIALDSAAVHFLSSTLLARGTIGGESKRIELNVDGEHAKVEDLLRLFVRSEPSPVSGPLAMHTHILVAPGREPFLQRVRMDGKFEVANGLFANKKTEAKLAVLSARASGRKNRPVTNAVTVRIGGHVELRNEIATLSNAFFAIPGAIAKGGGTYNLQNEGISLRGKLAMKATLSEATTGIKSILAVPLDPFFKKDGAGAVIPVRVTGTYADPKFKVSL